MSGDDQAIPLSTANTAIRFRVRWLGVLTVRGRFTGIQGTLRIPDGCLESAEVAIDVAAETVTTGISLRDRHLRGPRFLDAKRHPVVSFRSIAVERLNGVVVITGRLHLRGRERAISAHCPVDDSASTGAGHVRLRGEMLVPRVPHGVGLATGFRRLNPLLAAIGPMVAIAVEMTVPATELRRALLPSPGR